MTLQSHISKTMENFTLLSKMVLTQWDICLSLYQNKPPQKDLLQTTEENEHIIDSLELTLREDVISGIVLYAPRTVSLRQMISVLEMTTYQERIGDLLYNIARMAARMKPDGFARSIFGQRMIEQLEDSRMMMQNAIFAYTCADARLAREVIEADAGIDLRHQEIMRELPERLCQEPPSAETFAEAQMVTASAMHVERIGDNVTNIAEAAIFMTEGRNAKHPGADTEI